LYSDAGKINVRLLITEDRFVHDPNLVSDNEWFYESRLPRLPYMSPKFTSGTRLSGPNHHSSWRHFDVGFLAVFYVQSTSWTSSGDSTHAHYFGLAAPYWCLTILFSLLPVLKCRRMAIARKRRMWQRDGRCVHCGYDIRVTPDRCPECGKIPARPSIAAI
jgi:hypothetical protein